VVICGTVFGSWSDCRRDERCCSHDVDTGLLVSGLVVVACSDELNMLKLGAKRLGKNTKNVIDIKFIANSGE